MLIGLKAGDWGLVRSWRMEIRTGGGADVLFSGGEKIFLSWLGNEKFSGYLCSEVRKDCFLERLGIIF